MASNATMVSYWGTTNGINDAEEDCTIKSLNVRGDVYDLSSDCEDIQFGTTTVNDQKLTINDTEEFVLDGQKYRYCGSSLTSILQ